MSKTEDILEEACTVIGGCHGELVRMVTKRRFNARMVRAIVNRLRTHADKLESLIEEENICTSENTEN